MNQKEPPLKGGSSDLTVKRFFVMINATALYWHLCFTFYLCMEIFLSD
jgi:hypothetical protein